MSIEIKIKTVLLIAKFESDTENNKVISAKLHRLNIGSKLYLKDVVC